MYLDHITSDYSKFFTIDEFRTLVGDSGKGMAIRKLNKIDFLDGSFSFAPQHSLIFINNKPMTNTLIKSSKSIFTGVKKPGKATVTFYNCVPGVIAKTNVTTEKQLYNVISKCTSITVNFNEYMLSNVYISYEYYDKMDNILEDSIRLDKFNLPDIFDLMTSGCIEAKVTKLRLMG